MIPITDTFQGQKGKFGGMMRIVDGTRDETERWLSERALIGEWTPSQILKICALEEFISIVINTVTYQQLSGMGFNFGRETVGISEV